MFFQTLGCFPPRCGFTGCQISATRNIQWIHRNCQIRYYTVLISICTLPTHLDLPFLGVTSVVQQLRRHFNPYLPPSISMPLLLNTELEFIRTRHVSIVLPRSLIPINESHLNSLPMLSEEVLYMEEEVETGNSAPLTHAICNATGCFDTDNQSIFNFLRHFRYVFF